MLKIWQENSIWSLFYRVYHYFIIQKLYGWLIQHVKLLRPIYETRYNESPITLSMLFYQKVLGINRGCYWPVHFTSRVVSPKNIYVGVDAAPGISPGCYIQALGKVYIGDHTQVAPNVGIISSNHFMLDIRKHVINQVEIGAYCRIGMGSVILPGVKLGDFTTVAAGSIVSKSFPNGYCVIGGNPAEIIEDYSNNELIKNKFIRYSQPYHYNGYIPQHLFEEYRKKYLNV